ncbi:MAG: DUF5668 domain-containing protein [Treponema sp.]|jgi:hypothetical protein|nr:DUF5668 domain-containing protein [Treponema sp.]
MRLIVTHKTAARIIFIIGLFLMFLGSAFLLSSLVEKSRLSVLVSFCFVILGVGCAVLAINLNKRSLYLFFAAFFMQVGLFLFLSALSIIPVSFSDAWPLLSVFSGLALLPAGWHRYGSFRSRYMVPALAFVILGSALMIFSFDLVSFSFAQFMKNWWPLLLVLTGLTLTLIALSTNKHTGDMKR